MYDQPHFKTHDPDAIQSFIQTHPFALLSGVNAANQPVATQLPLLLTETPEGLRLQGHIMKNTDHYHAFLNNKHALAVFTGPHAYVSASWYTAPHNGSTWNYMSVYVKGEIEYMNPEMLVAFMRKFTLHFEHNNANSPTVFDNLDPSYIRKMMPAIVGINMKINTIDHVFKLSQNKDAISIDNIIQQLEKQDENARKIANEMKKSRK